MFRRAIVALALFLGMAAPVLCAAVPGHEPPPVGGIKTILSLDSARIRGANLSPDGKWLVFVRDSANGPDRGRSGWRR